ncbi:hypothetical protein IFM89_000706 [Coptis chinensis]|uniref:Uncharacterized protein n=1 Tax=Coptis chinensis TaxID=261450 RepID=A0A835LL54_9MAGN|nr:hypothetical protein IFM89_000706 [Coptis chinensis]
MASSSQHRGVSQSSPSGSQHRTLSQSSHSGSQHRTMSQSSPSGSQQPSVSQPSHSTGDNTSQSKKTKLPVIVQADGRVTGVYGGKWSSRVGHWIRAIVPISYASWDTVDDTFKDEVWGKLMNCESEQDAILSCPTGFDPSHWEAFAIRESTQEVKDLCAKNAQNRSMNFVDHTCGRKPYSRILEELDEANPGKKHRRTDGWKYGHEHRDGTVLNNARELYEQVTSVEEEMAEESSERGGDADYDITRDPLARVFGKDKGRRTRGYSSCMFNKQVQKFAIAEVLLEQESSSNSKLENELSEVKSTVGNLLAGQTRMETRWQLFQQSYSVWDEGIAWALDSPPKVKGVSGMKRIESSQGSKAGRLPSPLQFS